MLLFLCGTNSVRSPMAQAIAQHLAPRMWVDSTGVRSSYIHPYTREVLEEDDIDHRQLLYPSKLPFLPRCKIDNRTHSPILSTSD